MELEFHTKFRHWQSEAFIKTWRAKVNILRCWLYERKLDILGQPWNSLESKLI